MPEELNQEEMKKQICILDQEYKMYCDRLSKGNLFHLDNIMTCLNLRMGHIQKMLTHYRSKLD